MTNHRHLPYGTGVQKGAGPATMHAHTSELSAHALLLLAGR
ncbi:hypothetical protein OG407_00180 [Streptomyces sp. NBC_01515]